MAEDAEKIAIQDAIKERIKIGAEASLGEHLYNWGNVKTFYKNAEYHTCWLNNSYQNFNAGILLNFLDNAGAEGLVVRDYHRELIRKYIRLVERWIKYDKIDSLAGFDVLLTDACLTYAMDISTGQMYGENMNVNRDENLKSIPFNTLIKNALDSQKLDKCLRKFAPVNCHYTELKSALDDYKKITGAGGYANLPDEIQFLKFGDNTSNVLMLNHYLQQAGDMKSTPGSIFDDNTTMAITRFQRRYGLKETGIMDLITLQQMRVPAEYRMASLVANMERLRWLPPDLGQKYVMVNIADYKLEIIERFNTVMKMKIIVGKPYKQTPVFHAHMKFVVINPYWDVPQSIATEEILPILKKNPGYIDKNHMKLFNQSGVQLNPYRIGWSRVSGSYFPYKIRQVPGSWNALGAIKFLFPNSYNVYLHGTPQQKLFDKDIRTFSHGCMRVEDPMKMAVYILKNNGWGQERIEDQVRNKEEIWIVLKETIPVHVTYRTAWVDEKGLLCFRDDVYGRDEIFRSPVYKKNLNL
jgi:L,D-transpeptidase YcbB